MNISFCLAKVKDFRKERGKRYSAESIVKLLVAGLLSNKNNLKSISRFAESLTKKELEALGFTRGRAPCYSSLTLMVRKFIPETLQTAMAELIKYICDTKGLTYEILHVDGKTLRGSNSYGGNDQRQILTAFSSQLNSIADFVEIEGKDEHVAMLKLLSQYEVKDKIFTADAAFCHEKTCKKIIEQGGHFAFTLKANEPNLHYFIEQTFDKISTNDLQIRSFQENIDLYIQINLVHYLLAQWQNPLFELLFFLVFLHGKRLHQQ